MKPKVSAESQQTAFCGGTCARYGHETDYIPSNWRSCKLQLL